MSTSPIRLGTRASLLARWQAEWVAGQLRRRGVEVELVPISTSGDVQTEAIKQIGAQGLFTKEIQHALLQERIDLAVHSLKDLPTLQVPGACLASVPQRGPAADVLVCPKFASLDELPRGAVVGTGSLRRRAQLLHNRPDLHVEDIRGNIDTRLRKVRQGGYDAIILAEAGLRRLNLDDQITQVLPMSVLLPAVGQGALGLETRSDDSTTRRHVEPLNHPATHRAITAERAMLAALEGGCLAPIAAWGRLENDRLTLTGRVLGPDGAEKVEAELAAAPAEAACLGRQVAEKLSRQGAATLIQQSRRSTR